MQTRHTQMYTLTHTYIHNQIRIDTYTNIHSYIQTYTCTHKTHTQIRKHTCQYEKDRVQSSRSPRLRVCLAGVGGVGDALAGLVPPYAAAPPCLLTHPTPHLSRTPPTGFTLSSTSSLFFVVYRYIHILRKVAC